MIWINGPGSHSFKNDHQATGIDMKTFDISLTPEFDRALSVRERELCAVLEARDGLGVAAADGHDVTDFKDVAGEQSLVTVDEAQAELAGLELEQVLAARRRLHEHSYGRCLDCEEAIDLARLTAMPATAYCTTCQAGHERAAAAPQMH